MKNSRSRQLIRWTTLAALAAGVSSAAAQAWPMPPDPPSPPVSLQIPHCTVPAVRGLQLGAAKLKIAEANCAVGRIVHRRSLIGKGLVARTTPRAGIVLAENWRVRIVVSRGRR